MGSKGGGKGGGRRKRGKGAGNRSTPKRSPQEDDAGADTSPGSTASPSGKSPATNRRKVDNADPSTMEVEALDDGTEAAAAKAAEEAAQRLEAEAESQNVTPDETEKIAKAKEPTPPTDQEEQDGQDRTDGDEEAPRSPPQRQKAYAKVAAFSDSESDDDEVLDLTDILKPSERQEQAKKTAKKHREREAKIAEAKKLAEEKERKKTASMKAAKAKESATRDLAKQLDAAVDPPDTPKKQTSTKAKTKSKTKPRKPKFAYGSFAQTYVKLSFSARDIAKKDKPEFIVTRCTKVDTEPTLQRAIILYLRAYGWARFGSEHRRPEMELLDLFDRQEAVGWQNFTLGRFSRALRARMEDYYQRISSTRQASTWAAGLCHRLLKLHHDQWILRNDFVHAKDEAGMTREAAQVLRDRISAEYIQGPEGLEEEDVYLFQSSYEEVIQWPSGDKRQWLLEVESARRCAAASSV